MGRQGFRDCPACGENVHVRRNPCLCGHVFPPKSQNHVIVNNNITVQANSHANADTIKPSFYEDSCGVFNLDPGHTFDDLHGKDEALSLIMSALKAYNDTRGRIRPNCLIVSEPSNGKTVMVEAIEQMVGSDNVFRFNCESASLTGIQNSILDHPGDLPPLMIAEEIDKVRNPDDLLWMVAALDKRRELIKITARETKRRKIPFICLATCNDLPQLERWHAGAVASRFPNKIFLESMNDDVRKRILMESLVGLPSYDPAWIDKAIELGREIGNMQMRTLESILLCGQEKLMSGEYQATFLKASRLTANRN